MPRRGTREWNRQQNINRTQVITAEPVIIQTAETVIIEAQEYDSAPLKQKIAELTTEVSNKKRQIQQLKENNKQQKKIINLMKQKLEKEKQTNLNLGKQLEQLIDCLHGDKICWVLPNSQIRFNTILCKYYAIKVNGNPEECKYHITATQTTDFKEIQEYISQLEMIICNNKLALDCMCEIHGKAKQIQTTNDNFIKTVKKYGNKSCDNNPNFYGNSGNSIRSGGNIYNRFHEI